MFFHMVYKSGQIFLPFCHNTRVWQTDGQTDRRTEFSSLYRVCITCSAVKKLYILGVPMNKLGNWLILTNRKLNQILSFVMWQYETQLFRTCKAHFIFGEKCAHLSALYYVNALYVFLDFYSLVFWYWIFSNQSAVMFENFHNSLNSF